jgi:hypothetical protein
MLAFRLTSDLFKSTAQLTRKQADPILHTFCCCKLSILLLLLPLEHDLVGTAHASIWLCDPPGSASAAAPIHQR